MCVVAGLRARRIVRRAVSGLAGDIEEKFDAMLDSIVDSPTTVLDVGPAARIDWDGMRAQIKDWILLLSK